MVVWSHYKPFWTDELLEFYSDSKPTVALVVSGQLHAPFSLEPPAFHLIAHALLAFIPSPELALRLPAMASLLVTELCVFLIAWELLRAGASAVFAMLMPMVLMTVDYGAEARVYSMLTACLAVALMCWVRAIRLQVRSRYLLLLSASLGLAAVLHYYGVLLAFPLFAGETVRTIQRRRIDKATIGAISCGALCVVFDLPFQRALAPIRAHYYTTGQHEWRMVPYTYCWLLDHSRTYQLPTPTADRVGLVVILALLALIGAAFMNGRKAKPELWALSATSLLPALDIGVAQFTRAYSPRYSLPAVIGVAVLTAAVLFRFEVVSRFGYVLCGVLFCYGLFYGLGQTRSYRNEHRMLLAQELSNERIVAEISRNEHIYIQDTSHFLVTQFYGSPAVKRATVGVYSADREMRWKGVTAATQFILNMQRTTSLPFTSFDELRQGPRLVVVYGSADDWMKDEIGSSGYPSSSMTKAFGGDLVRVSFPPN